MSTAELVGGRGGSPADATLIRSRAALTLPALVAVALLALVLYAAFDHGAVAVGVEARLEVALAAIAAVACAGWLGTRSLRFAAPRAGLAGVALLAGFAVWCGVTLVWSVAPDQTWIEVNRAISYVLFLCLAIAVGASHARAVDLVARGFLAVSLAVTIYALAQKLFPGLHVSGVFDLNQTGPLPRLQAPLGYWNALALFVVLGLPAALALASDSSRPQSRRVTAGAVVSLMLVTVGLTYSRGGLLALAVALIVVIAMSGNWLRPVLWLGLAALAAVPPLAVGLTSHSLTTAGVGLGAREGAGAILAGVLAASLVALVLASRQLIVRERKLAERPDLERRAQRGVLAALLALLACGVVALALSSRGLTGSISHAWSTFASTRTASNVNPSRLLSVDSENRWVWWKEAASAFGDRPAGGWGAGSFGVLHLIYRRNTLPVQQPHSVPLQFLAETGIVGALLALAAFTALLGAAVTAVRRITGGMAQRGLAAALLAGAVAYLMHSLYDWDWNIPALTLPALMFLGVLAGTAARRSTPAREMRLAAEGGGFGTRALWLGGLTLWLCLFAISALLPSVAANKADAALIEASTPSPGALAQAQATARLASRLDPLSDAGLRAEASIAFRRGEVARARNYLQQALQREPSDAGTWDELAQFELLLGDRVGARADALRVIALDPMGSSARQLKRARALSEPPWNPAPRASGK